MAFTNRIRLPFKITRAQFPETKSVYRKADGSSKTLSVVIEKTYEGETDWLSEKWHERLTIALGHDNVTIEGDKYLGGVSKDGDYEIDWPDFLDYPTGKAKFTVKVTPFDNTNSNCQTCDEATQLSLVDDTFPSELEEATTYTMNIAENDGICCYPSVFSITSFNSDFIEAPSIDADGILTIQTKAHFVSGNGVKLLTYRVTCSNGGFDEADVFADLTGDEPGCLAPTGLVISEITADGFHFHFDAPTPAPNHYLYRIYKASAPGIIVQTADVDVLDINIGDLDPDTDYIVYVRSQCDATDDDGTASNFIDAAVTTANSTSLCGSYTVAYDNFEMFPVPGISVTYMDCSGNNISDFVLNHRSKTFCVLQTSPGSPVSIVSSRPTETSINYNGLC